MSDVCGKYVGDNDGTCPQLTCVRDWGHGGNCDNVSPDRPNKRDWVQLAKERAEAATPGPWVREDDWMCEVNAELRDLGVGSVTYKNVVKLVDGLDRVCFRGAPDAEFIAAARSDIPRLIACVEAADALSGAYEAMGNAHHLECLTPYEALPTGECGCHFKAIDAALAAYRTARARGGV